MDLCTINQATCVWHGPRVCGLAVLQSLQGHLAEVKGLLGEPQEVTVASLEGIGSLADWWQVFRVTQVRLFSPPGQAQVACMSRSLVD